MSDHPVQDPAITERNWALAVYVLYLVSLANGVTALVGVIMAHMKVNSANALWHSHFAFQIRTFWYSILFFVIGVFMCVTVILLPFGMLLLAVIGLWFVARCIVGLLKMLGGEPIPAPHSLLLGL